jgi:hypothetical protein
VAPNAIEWTFQLDQVLPVNEPIIHHYNICAVLTDTINTLDEQTAICADISFVSPRYRLNSIELRYLFLTVAELGSRTTSLGLTLPPDHLATEPPFLAGSWAGLESLSINTRPNQALYTRIPPLFGPGVVLPNLKELYVADAALRAGGVCGAQTWRGPGAEVGALARCASAGRRHGCSQVPRSTDAA